MLVKLKPGFIAVVFILCTFEQFLDVRKTTKQTKTRVFRDLCFRRRCGMSSPNVMNQNVLDSFYLLVQIEL